eukprot:TRINITY_DN1019_c0_g1_i1.p1 TRINITY_DN1019_c0_g1~~TRINITY_DN1019_c0_g1_i1.p1  ORF type:complete len:511 (+),score=176.91 TRINITY_DN1019_c0_g1_i1:41-1573(+)
MSHPPPPPPRDLPPPPPVRQTTSPDLNLEDLPVPALPPPPPMDMDAPVRAASHEGDQMVKINHKGLVNNPAFADVHLMVGKKTIYAHSYILQLRAPKLIEVKGVAIKKKKGIIVREMNKDTRENILLEVLGYVYSDEIDLSKTSVPDVLQINAYAMEYEIIRLQWLCETHLRELLNRENVYEVLIEANKANQQRVKDFCFHFIVNNYDSFIANKAKTSLLGIELFQDAIAVNQQKETGTLKPLDLKPCPPSTLVADLRRMHETMKDSIEATIFRVGTLAPTYVTAHKALLAARTPQLHALCSAPAVKGPPEHIPVPNLRTRSVFENVSAEAFETLLKYVYYGNANIPALHACELIPFTIDYGMEELQRLCYSKIQVSIDPKTALPILGVTYIQPPETGPNLFLGIPVESIRKDAIDFILSHLAQTDLTLLPRMFPRIAVDLMLANQKKERVHKGLAVDSEPEAPKAEHKKEEKKERKLEKAPSSMKVSKASPEPEERKERKEKKEKREKK